MSMREYARCLNIIDSTPSKACFRVFIDSKTTDPRVKTPFDESGNL